MKLYIYDQKHNTIFGELEIENESINQVQKVIEFLREKGMLSRYAELILAKSYRIGYEDDNDERNLVFIH